MFIKVYLLAEEKSVNYRKYKGNKSHGPTSQGEKLLLMYREFSLRVVWRFLILEKAYTFVYTQFTSIFNGLFSEIEV